MSPAGGGDDGKGKDSLFASDAGDVQPSGFLPFTTANMRKRRLTDAKHDEPAIGARPQGTQRNASRRLRVEVSESLKPGAPRWHPARYLGSAWRLPSTSPARRRRVCATASSARTSSSSSRP